MFGFDPLDAPAHDPDEPTNWASIYYRVDRQLSDAQIVAVRAAMKRQYSCQTSMNHYVSGGGDNMLSLHCRGVRNRADMAAFVQFGDALASRLIAGAERFRPPRS